MCRRKAGAISIRRGARLSLNGGWHTDTLVVRPPRSSLPSAVLRYPPNPSVVSHHPRTPPPRCGCQSPSARGVRHPPARGVRHPSLAPVSAVVRAARRRRARATRRCQTLAARLGVSRRLLPSVSDIHRSPRCQPPPAAFGVRHPPLAPVSAIVHAARRRWARATRRCQSPPLICRACG
jgi:hypothetical protein